MCSEGLTMAGLWSVGSGSVARFKYQCDILTLTAPRWKFAGRHLGWQRDCLIWLLGPGISTYSKVFLSALARSYLHACLTIVPEEDSGTVTSEIHLGLWIASVKMDVTTCPGALYQGKCMFSPWHGSQSGWKPRGKDCPVLTKWDKTDNWSWDSLGNTESGTWAQGDYNEDQGT
jgi:hypothetical protein